MKVKLIPGRGALLRPDIMAEVMMMIIRWMLNDFHKIGPSRVVGNGSTDATYCKYDLKLIIIPPHNPPNICK